MTVSGHRLCLLVIAALSAAALSACGAGNSGTAKVPPLAGYAGAGAWDAITQRTGAQGVGGDDGNYGFGRQSARGTDTGDGADTGDGTGTGAGTDTGDDTASGNEPLPVDNVQSLGGRATYEGGAAGVYAGGEPFLAFRYFQANVRLTADFRDNYIWGVITDGRDTTTLEQLFERLSLEPAALDADETVFFENRVTGVVGGELFTGEWSGRFSGGGDPRGAVAGTFWAQTDDPEESLFGAFDTTYRAHVNRTVQALNEASEKIKGRLAYNMAGTARTDAVSNADALDTVVSDPGDVAWNTGVTQSPQDDSSGDGVEVNQAINARYEEDALVFDRINLSSQPPARLTTSDEPEAPGYRQAISPMPGSPRWKGVEHLAIDSSRRWNYSILFSDITDNDDADYLAGGISIWMPDLDDPADTRMPLFAVAASGNDPFQVANVEALEGRVTYDGDAAGFYASRITTPALRYFNADVRLTADFEDNRIRGVVTEGRDTATNELVFRELELRSADLHTDGAAFFENWVSGVVNGRPVTGDWGGQFFGNGESTTDRPGSVAGTFGARTRDRTESLVGFFGAYDRELTRLPAGHGLDAGRIIVEPGDSVERGEVSIACPEGGSACILTVEADGAAFYDRDGGIPGLGSVHGAHWQDNPSAEDLLDHWNDPPVDLRDELGLSTVREADVDGRKDALKTLLESAGGDPAGSGTSLRNVRPEDIEIIGERGGITYGRWKGGPAGTLNIEFDWRFAAYFDSSTWARMERTGKSWSWRILDDFGTHVVGQGTEIDHATAIAEAGSFHGVVDADVSTDGVLIAVLYNDGVSRSSGSAKRSDRTADDYQPWFGSVLLAGEDGDNTGTMAHEIGHVLGITAYHAPSAQRYINTEDHTFEGPEAQRVNGGKPVPFQWWMDKSTPVSPDTPGAEVDYGHLAVCAAIMAYCSDRMVTYTPSELDFAYLADIGYEILDAETASQPELYGYGAWGRYSAWGAGVERTIEYEGGRIVGTRDTLRAGVNAFGTVPTAALGEAPTTLQGNVTWSGSLIGIDRGQAMLPPVFGDAELSVELSTLQGAAVFDDLTVHVDGTSSDFRSPRLEYTIGVAGNSFSDQDGRVLGGFFGPAHEEMAGVLDDRTPEVDLLAGFGGKR